MEPRRICNNRSPAPIDWFSAETHARQQRSLPCAPGRGEAVEGRRCDPLPKPSLPKQVAGSGYWGRGQAGQSPIHRQTSRSVQEEASRDRNLESGSIPEWVGQPGGVYNSRSSAPCHVTAPISSWGMRSYGGAAYRCWQCALHQTQRTVLTREALLYGISTNTRCMLWSVQERSRSSPYLHYPYPDPPHLDRHRSWSTKCRLTHPSCKRPQDPPQEGCLAQDSEALKAAILERIWCTQSRCKIHLAHALRLFLSHCALQEQMAP